MLIAISGLLRVLIGRSLQSKLASPASLGVSGRLFLKIYGFVGPKWTQNYITGAKTRRKGRGARAAYSVAASLPTP